MKLTKQAKRWVWIKSAIIVTAILIPSILFANWCLDNPEYDYAEVSVPKNNKPMIDWVLDEVEKAGLNRYEAYMVIKQESNWKSDICIIEPNDTISCGLWMLNTVHNKKGLTNACKIDYKCATGFAIKLYKERGGWSAWSVAKQLGLK